MCLQFHSVKGPSKKHDNIWVRVLFGSLRLRFDTGQNLGAGSVRSCWTSGTFPSLVYILPSDMSLLSLVTSRAAATTVGSVRLIVFWRPPPVLAPALTRRSRGPAACSWVKYYDMTAASVSVVQGDDIRPGMLSAVAAGDSRCDLSQTGTVVAASPAAKLTFPSIARSRDFSRLTDRALRSTPYRLSQS